MNDNDNDIFEKVAQLWVSCGGDDIGFNYCTDVIENRIREILEESK